MKRVHKLSVYKPGVLAMVISAVKLYIAFHAGEIFRKPKAGCIGRGVVAQVFHYVVAVYAIINDGSHLIAPCTVISGIRIEMYLVYGIGITVSGRKPNDFL